LPIAFSFHLDGGFGLLVLILIWQVSVIVREEKSRRYARECSKRFSLPIYRSASKWDHLGGLTLSAFPPIFCISSPHLSTSTEKVPRWSWTLMVMDFGRGLRWSWTFSWTLAVMDVDGHGLFDGRGLRRSWKNGARELCTLLILPIICLLTFVAVNFSQNCQCSSIFLQDPLIIYCLCGHEEWSHITFIVMLMMNYCNFQ
jgi:hypothetical protein